MRYNLRAAAITCLCCILPISAMAAVAAPGPEIGDGIAGGAVAMVALLAVMMLPRLNRSRQPKD